MKWATIRGLLLGLLLSAACEKTDSPGSPSPAPSPQPGSGTTITVTSAGATPKTLVVPRGSQITFINQDSVPHEMYSDPHPEHTDCPQFDSVGYLLPGQSRQTQNLVDARTCRFHDHGDANNSSLKGSIVIQ